MVEQNQEIKSDAGKPRLTLVPRQILKDIARIREYGLAKYGDSESWKSVEIERYRDAAFRHFVAYLDDPSGVDSESGLTHLAHLACNIAFLCELEKENARQSEKVDRQTTGHDGKANKEDLYGSATRNSGKVGLLYIDCGDESGFAIQGMEIRGHERG